MENENIVSAKARQGACSDRVPKGSYLFGFL